MIYRQDAPSLNVFCIHSGSVELYRQGNNGKDVVIGTRRTGDLIGFEAVLADRPYADTALVIRQSVICAITRAVLLDLLEGCPELGRCLLETACNRAILAQVELASRTHARVAGRVARWLLDLRGRATDRDGNVSALQTSMPREAMARQLDTTPETLSRALHRLAAMGVIELVGRRGIAVCDPSALEALCDDCPLP